MTIVDNGRLRDRSTIDLIKDLTHQASTLVHQEVELAKLEMTEKAKSAGLGLALLAAAAIAGLLALGALTAFLILALDGAMPNWAAALVVTAMWLVAGGVLALWGRQKIDEMGTPVPSRTIESVKEDVEWLKHPTS